TEGSAVPLTIGVALADTDGSETLSPVRISGVPASSALSAGVNQGNGVWTLTAAELNGLKLLTTDDFPATLSVSATSTERSSGDTATTTRTLTVRVADVAPKATLTNSGPLDKPGSVKVSFTGASDPSPVDSADGFHYSYALSRAGLAADYDSAG